MAQLVAVPIWTERQRTVRFGLHTTSHLENHEEQAYQALVRLQGVKIERDFSPIIAGDLATLTEPLGYCCW